MTMMTLSLAMELLENFTDMELVCSVIDGDVIRGYGYDDNECEIALDDFVEWLDITISDHMPDRMVPELIERCLEYLE